MKKIFLAIAIVVISISAKAQTLGDIEVSINNHATLIFPEDIMPGGDVIIPNPGTVINKNENTIVCEFITISINKNMVIIRAEKENIGQRTITIMLSSGDIYTGSLIYSKMPKKSLYDYRMFPTTKKEKEKQEKDSISIQLAKLQTKLEIVLSKKNEFEDIGCMINKTEFQFANMVNDEKYSYIKIVVYNNQASAFYPKGALFKYEDKMKRKMKKSNLENVNWLDPVFESLPEKIDAYSKAVIGFVLPLYTTTERGDLFIKFIEKEGNRDGIIEVSAKIIAGIKVL